MDTIKQATWTCPAVINTDSARLDILDTALLADGRANHYLINPYEQGLASAHGNVAGLRYESDPPRWFIGDTEVAGTGRPLDMHYVYQITYMGHGVHGDFQPTGATWIGVHPDYPDVYFWFTMPVSVKGIKMVDEAATYDVEYSDHPTCGYGSAPRATIDALLAPRA